MDWIKGAAFVTPAGYWHEHVNESGADAFVMPIQDAGLHSYLRTLDIQFYHHEKIEKHLSLAGGRAVHSLLIHWWLYVKQKSWTRGLSSP